jgi:hypothetical protein
MKLTPGNLVAYNLAALERKLSIAEDGMQARFGSELAPFSGVIPTDVGVWKVANEITNAKPTEITGPVAPKRGVAPGSGNGTVSRGFLIRKPVPDDVLWFTAEHAWWFSTLESKGDLAISADPHELISGETRFNEQDLFHFHHTSSATLKAGPELQRGDFDFDVTRTKKVTFGFHLNGQYLRDENQKFGYVAGPKFTDEEWGPTPKAFVEWSPSQGPSSPTPGWNFPSNFITSTFMRPRALS